MQGYPICRILIVALGPTSGEAMNPQVGPTLRCPAWLSIFCLAVEAIAFISSCLVVQRPRKTLTKKRAAHSGPLGGAGARDSGAPIINTKKRRRRASWEVLTEIRERPPST
jgi:hypothetical protein